jgi:hypothetical protein
LTRDCSRSAGVHLGPNLHWNDGTAAGSSPIYRRRHPPRTCGGRGPRWLCLGLPGKEAVAGLRASSILRRRADNVNAEPAGEP